LIDPDTVLCFISAELLASALAFDDNVNSSGIHILLPASREGNGSDLKKKEKKERTRLHAV